MQVPRERIRTLQAAVCSDLRRLVALGPAVLNPVPSPDVDEGLFRQHMLAEASRVGGLHKDLAQALAECHEVRNATSLHDGDKLPDNLDDLQGSAMEVRDLTFYFVSLYAAVTVFRNPNKDKDGTQKLAGILDNIGKLTLRQHWCGQALLEEMRQSVVVGASSSAPAKRKATPASAEAAPALPASKRARGSGAGRGDGGRGKRGSTGGDGQDLRGIFAEGGGQAAARAKRDR